MLLITPESSSNLSDFGGTKAQNLVKLVKQGYNIPKFAVISIPRSQNENNAQKWLENILNNLKSELETYFGNCNFAIRSNTQIEDSFENSKAGYFKTVLDISLIDIGEAIFEVYQDCFSKLNSKEFYGISGDIADIFIIIQQFIQPKLAGVVFSRDPNGSGSLTLDYTFGLGDKIVSGQTTTNVVYAYSSQNFKSKIKFKQLEPLFKIARKIETDFDYPQDIEWCTTDNQLYILQARPITNLNSNQIATYPILDSIINKFPKFHFYKPELAEITPKPKTFILNIIEKLYQNNGPIALTYRKLGIKYNFTNFIKILGCDLFFDQILERKAFFSLNKPFSSLVNIFKFSFLKSPDPNLQFELLTKEIIKKTQIQDLNQSIQDFLEVYKLIFSTNLFAAKELHTLTQLTSQTKASLYLDAANDDFDFSNVLNYVAEQNWAGNSLNIEDESKSQTFLPKSKSGLNNNLETLLEKEPSWKIQRLKQVINKTKNWLQLRELSRILTVKYINSIRNALDKQIINKSDVYKRNKYFIDLESFDQENDASLALKFDQFNTYHNLEWTNLISSQNLITSTKELISVSSGVAKGEIYILSDFKDLNPTSIKNKIILVDTLNPELVIFFDQIAGIISKQGSLLSHLAIVAREQKIPVLTNYKQNIYNLKNGDIVTIDCNQARIS